MENKEAKVTGQGIAPKVDEKGNPVVEKQGEGNQQPNADEGKKVQTQEENAEFARQRREAEKVKIAKDAEVKAIILATDGINPYTQKPIVDEYDVEEFKIMQGLKKEGKDPVADYHEAVKNQRKQSEQKMAEKAMDEEAVRKDISSFKAQHPDVDIASLMKDDKFKVFSKHTLTRVPLNEIYNDFLEAFPDKSPVEIAKAKQKEAELAAEAQRQANGQASPGSLGKQGDDGGQEFYSVEQIKKMSQKDVDANYEKVQKSLRKAGVIK